MRVEIIVHRSRVPSVQRPKLSLYNVSGSTAALSTVMLPGWDDGHLSMSLAVSRLAALGLHFTLF